jgi:hypothetical protein
LAALPPGEAMKPISFLFAAVFIQLSSLNGLSATTNRLTDTTTVVFASIEAGQAALQTPDRYTKALSRFDLTSRLRTNDDVTADDLMKLAAQQVVAWSEDDRAKMEPIIASVAERFAKFNLPLPPNILLIQTTGKEEGDAAYCRRHAVILPRRYVGFPASQLEPIFIHELFHVLSSHNELLRNSLYEIIGFKPCAEIALPESLADFKITNPDGPLLNYYIELDVDGQRRLAVPFLYSEERFDPQQSRSFFHPWRPLENERAELITPRTATSLYPSIDCNAEYIIHPDEVLADNFMKLIMQKPDLPNPEIVSKIAEQLMAK